MTSQVSGITIVRYPRLSGIVTQSRLSIVSNVPDHSWISGIVHPIHTLVGKVPDHSWISGIAQPIHTIVDKVPDHSWISGTVHPIHLSW